MDEFTYLEAYISNLGKYTEGKPTGEWVSFPTTTEQMKAVFDRIGIDGKNYQEWHITEYKSDIPGLANCLGEYENLDELNYLGKLLEMQDDIDRTDITVDIELGDRTGSLKDIINLAQNLSCYWHYPTAHNEEEYGQYLVDELETIELPEEARKYFDYEAYGRDTSINEGGKFTELGYVMNNRDPFTEWYDGRDVPEEYRVTPQLPQPERPDPEKVEMDAAPAAQAATMTAEPPQPRPVIPLVLNAEKPAEKLKEITDRLEQGISEIFESGRYKEYLDTMSKFHNYSVNNTILIAMQKPDASLIAGFNSWKNQFERNVKKGEKGIKIIAPSPFKVKKEMEKIDPQTQRPVIGKDGKPVTVEQEVTIPAFKVVAVFDVSQTEGKELPDIAVDTLTGDVDKYKDFFAALEKTAPVPIGFEKMGGGTHGYYHLEDKRIAIAEGMSELQTLKTTIHEIAHAKLHDIDLNAPISEQQNRPDRRTREVEAESIAYTVCQHYGLDTSDYSFGYVAGWSSDKELSELKSSLETIRSTAAELINTIDGHITEIQKEHTAEQEQPTTPEYIYKVHANPRSESIKDRYMLQAYIPQENGMAKIGDVLFVGTPEKCRELMGQLVSGELTQEQVKELFAKEQEQPTPEQDNTFSIYQLKGGDEMRDFRFEPYDRLQAAGLALDPENYEQTYTAPLENGMSLEGIFEKFNLDRPADFTGHSLSVSDVVVLHQNGQNTAHYVDSFGYKEVPEFLQPEKTFDLQHTIDQLHKIHENIMSANPDKTMGQAAYRMAIKRLDKLSGELPQEQAQLKELVSFATQSPDLPTLNERMTEIVNTFPPLVTTEHEQPTLAAEQPQETAQTAVTYYPINETAARRAKEANSFSDYKPGSATAEYRSMVDEAVQLAERQKARVDPMHHEKIDRLLDTYARKLAENMNSSFAIESRVPSILIVGGSNFPVRKKEKQNAARDKNMEEWRDIKGLIEKIRSTGMGGISADDPNAIAKLESKLAGLEKSQETMKAANAFYRKHKTLDGCPVLTAEQIQKLTADMQTRWYGRAASQPFEAYSLQNNNAEINRLKKRIEELTHREETPLTGWEFDGGKVEVNKKDNRLQVFFEEKPDADKRTELKKGGFRWSPTAGAWQRQLNGNALYAANDIKCIQPLTGERPTDLQRAHIRAEKAKEQAEQQPPQDSTHDAEPQAATPAPDNFLTGETVQTPRGSFRLTSMSQPEMEAVGYGFHHQSDDGQYFIMGNGTQAFAILNQAFKEQTATVPTPENPLAAVEQTTEQNANMIDGVINNTPTVDELEAKVKAGEQISLTDLADAIKADKQRGGAPKEKPSIRAQLKADKGKTPPKKAAEKNKTDDLERS